MPRKSPQQAPHLDRRAADDAYRRALREAGVAQDDLVLLRELAQQTQTLTTRVANQPTRIYL